MHTGVILLTKAEDRSEAQNNVESFLEDYHMDVYDWYSIGNRWHNALAPKDKLDEFESWVREEYAEQMEGGVYSVDDLENPEDRAKIQKKWEDLGLQGKNTFYSSYGFDVEDTEQDYNIVPLANCLETVKEWCLDLEKTAERLFKRVEEEREKEKNDEKTYPMSGYYASRYADAKGGYFCFDSQVFNTTTYDAEEIPEEIEEYWAVIVDMHN